MAIEVYSWGNVEKRVSQWLGEVKRDIDTPDLWAGVLDKIQSEGPPDLSGTVAPDGTVTLVLTDIEGSTALNASFGVSLG